MCLYFPLWSLTSSPLHSFSREIPPSIFPDCLHVGTPGRTSHRQRAPGSWSGGLCVGNKDIFSEFVRHKLNDAIPSLYRSHSLYRSGLHRHKEASWLTHLQLRHVYTKFALRYGSTLVLRNQICRVWLLAVHTYTVVIGTYMRLLSLHIRSRYQTYY